MDESGTGSGVEWSRGVTREAEDGEVDDAAGSFVRSRCGCGWGSGQVLGQVSTASCLLCYYCTYGVYAGRKTQHAALILDRWIVVIVPRRRESGSSKSWPPALFDSI